MSSPPVSRRQLSAQMRRLRLDAGLTMEQAADKLEWSTTKVSNIETGRSKKPAVTDIRALLEAYRVTDERERDSVLALTRQSRERGWWNRYDDVLGGAFASLEAGARSLKLFEPQYIPGLFQTAEYAEAIAQATLIRDPGDIERTVEARMKRQEILSDEGAPDVWAIVHESAIEMLRATPSLFSQQVARLREVAETPSKVTLQVMPVCAGLHAGMGGPFVIMDFEDPGESIVFLETDTDGLYLDKAQEIERYRKLFDRILAKALDPDEVPDYLRSLSV
ncbi:helix-turn-helix domain-containing protein [Streptomonospora litoralis]|uniref:Helix-turn-helix protein n=1 Tax=Streptomonospora litoralis TaxID=2498135 RepID=A0A4P6PXD7_9ACTN|nr:helix-turn-helix transcriptional regulator [Streptomonospora litoralis]QBI52916.1 Helix-turn-helix protein [Streptomonospora litoralis]